MAISHMLEVPNWSAKRLLHIEDDACCQVLVEEYLRESGIQITTCKNGREVSVLDDLIENHDLILLDVKLPDTDGLKLCKHFAKVAPKIPVIIHTAINEPNLVFNCYQNGAREVMFKPASVNIFFDSLQRYLN